jgi:large subunit ribosomal protein L25
MAKQQQTLSFTAERRDQFGKGPARALRRAAKVPAIVYGGGEEHVSIALPFKELKLALSTNPRFFSSVIELSLDGETTRVLAREAQVHPVSDDPLHVDFIRAGRGAKVTIAVPVRFVNEDQSPGLKGGATLNIVRREVELVCPAESIPAELVADLAGTEIGDSIHISSVTLPQGVELDISDRDFTIASLVPPSVEETPEETAEAAAEGDNG